MRAEIGRTVKYLRATLDSVHAFRGPAGELACTLMRATVYHDGTAAVGFELDARFSPESWQAVVEQAAFEVTPGNRGAMLGGELSPDAPVDATLFLRPQHLARWFSAPDAFAAEAGRLLAALAAGEPVNDSDAWVFLSVTQAISGRVFQVGYRHAAYDEVDSHLVFG